MPTPTEVCGHSSKSKPITKAVSKNIQVSLNPSPLIYETEIRLKTQCVVNYLCKCICPAVDPKTNLHKAYIPVVQNLLSMYKVLGASQESQTVLSFFIKCSKKIIEGYEETYV